MNRLTFKIDLAQATSYEHQPAFQAPHELALPCPSVTLFDLALAFNSAAGRADRLQRLLRLNPSLLLFALDSYRYFKQEPAESINQLIVWCEKNLLTVLLQGDLQTWITPPPAPEKTRQRLKRFLDSRDNHTLRKSLNRWAKHAAGPSPLEQPSGLRKKWLKRILATSFCPDGFLVRKLNKKSTLNATFYQWTVPTPSAVSPRIKSLLKLAATASRTQAEYQLQLETEKLAAMKQLAYGASHEINNPLANVATRSQTMLADETHPEKRTKLATIYQQAMRAHEMISDMMLFAHPPATIATAVSLRQIVRRFIGEQECCFDKDEAIKTDIFIGPGVDRVCLDPTQFLVVLQMLVRNSKEAIRATKDAAGEIEIRADLVDRQTPSLPQRLQLGQASKFLQVSVQDNGIGVDARVRRHLFDPFFSGREAGRGLGFGLSKCWRIIEQHGGEIILDEDHAQGTRFLFWLPQSDSCS